MNYRKDTISGKDLSILGYGCMRFSRNGRKIDIRKAEKEILYAIEQGVNYFDTAYVYPGSEETLGEILAKGFRNQVYIATKLPHYLIKTRADMNRYFEEQKKRLQTDYIDYYLMHMLPDTAAFQRLVDLGLLDFIREKKENGQIRQIGFSYHGGTESFIELVDSYDWDFCQIQYNYLDEHKQAGKRGLLYAAEKGLPVIIMEPLRGGRLVNNLPENVKKKFAEKIPKRSAAEWALRWIWNHKEATVILSGMNSMEQVEENVRIASSVQAGELTEDDIAFFSEVKNELEQKVKVSCTGCGYCMPCPKGVDIPVCFHCYNTKYTDRKMTAMREYLMCTTMRAKPTNASLCVGCGKCEQHCPQEIPIREKLKEVTKNMETLPYRIAKWSIRTFAKF